MNHRLRSAVIAAGVVLFDRLTKLYIRANFSFTDMVSVIPGFANIVHAENPGAAFSMLADSPGPWRSVVLIGISLVVMVAISVVLWRPPAGMSSSWVQVGLALVLGGALGNFWDRAFRGTVTDFLQLWFGSYEFPSFNVADSAISIGAAMLILDMLRGKSAVVKSTT